MNRYRYIPELALLTGLLLALPFAGFTFWATGELTSSLVVAAALLYPFALYAVRHDEDPTTVLPPRAVGLGGGIAGTLLVLDSFATASTPAPLPTALLRGLFFGLLVALPTAAYAVGYGEFGHRVPGRPVLAGGVAVGFLLVVAGVLAGTTYGVADGLLLALASGLFAKRCGYQPTQETKLVAVGGAVLVGTALVVLSLTFDAPLLPSVLAAVAVVLGPGIYYALTVESASFE